MSDIPSDDDSPRDEIVGTTLVEVLTYGWRRFIQNIGQWIVVWLVVAGLVLAARIAFSTLLATTVTTTPDGTTEGGFSLGLVLAGAGLGVVEGILWVVVARAAVPVVEGGTVDVRAAFRLTGPNLVAGGIFGFLYGLLSLLPPNGLLGIAAFVVLGFVPVVSALDDRGADALGAAWQVLRRQPKSTVPFCIVGWLLTGCICALGAPITMLGGTYLVKRFRDEPVAQ